MKRRVLQKLGAVLLAAAMCISSVPSGFVRAADKPANVSRVTVHDPSILKADGTYYLFGSHLADAKSADLLNWNQINIDWNWRKPAGSWQNDSVYGEVLENFAESFAWAGYDDGDCANGGLGFWAPDVIYNPHYVWGDSSEGAYMLYYCTTSSWRRSCIGYAVSKTPEGPYEYVDTIIYSGFTKNGEVDNGNNGGVSTRNTKWDNDYLNLSELIEDGTLAGVSDKWFTSNGGWNENYAPNAIDPTVFFGKDGKLYMTYGSWSGGIFVQELDIATGAVKYPGEDGTESVSGNFIDRYFGTHIAGGSHKSGEGAYILYDSESDYYYMYETYGGLGDYGGYNMRLFRSKNVYGPYTDAAGNNAKDNNSNNDRYGIKLIGNYQFPNQPGYRSAGHNSALIDDDGQRYLFYHQRFEPSSLHQVRVRQQYLNEDQWPVLTVYEFRGDKIGHYQDSEIVGSYDLINHGTATNGDMIYSQNVVLFADGTVGGAMTGTWAKSTGEGKNYDYITLNLGDVVYKGIVCKQFNEEAVPQKVMTFSVIGNDNTCLWGSKVAAQKELSKALVYGFNFEKGAAAGSIAPVKHSTKSGKAVLNGNASIVADNQRGSVLQVQNVGNSYRANYLGLPADAFSTVTEDGFTVSMWVNVGAETLEDSALFEASSGSGEAANPMTRLSADISPSINANVEAKGLSYEMERDEWHHVAYSVNSEGLRLFVDGKIVGALLQDLSSCFDKSLEDCIQKTENISIGSGVVYGTEDVQSARFDDVAIYSAALSDEQVAEIYSTDTLKEVPEPEPEPPKPEEPKEKGIQTISVNSSFNKTYGNKPFLLNAKLTKGDGALSYSSDSPKVASVDSRTGKVTIKNTGIAKITVTAAETAAFKKQTKTVTIQVAPKKISLTSVKSTSAKKAALKWKAASKASGYSIQYAANSKFKSARTVLVKKVNVKTKTITKLKSKKTYYFRIRPYKQSGKTKVYGAYSKAKHIKVK